MFGRYLIPQDAVRNHPTVRQVDISTELDGHHFAVHLDNDAFQPAAYTLTALFVVAIYFYSVADFISMLGAG